MRSPTASPTSRRTGSPREPHGSRRRRRHRCRCHQRRVPRQPDDLPRPRCALRRRHRPGRAPKAQAEKYGIAGSGTVEELLAHPEIEIVVNLTIPAAHVEVALRALAAGKNVWTEKPFALDRESGKKLLSEAAELGLRVATAPDTFLGAGPADRAAPDRGGRYRHTAHGSRPHAVARPRLLAPESRVPLPGGRRAAVRHRPLLPDDAGADLRSGEARHRGRLDVATGSRDRLGSTCRAPRSTSRCRHTTAHSSSSRAEPQPRRSSASSRTAGAPDSSRSPAQRERSHFLTRTPSRATPWSSTAPTTTVARFPPSVRSRRAAPVWPSWHRPFAPVVPSAPPGRRPTTCSTSWFRSPSRPAVARRSRSRAASRRLPRSSGLGPHGRDALIGDRA